MKIATRKQVAYIVKEGLLVKKKAFFRIPGRWDGQHEGDKVRSKKRRGNTF